LALVTAAIVLWNTVYLGRALDVVRRRGKKSDVLQERCEAALVKAHLKPDGIKSDFLKPFGKKAKSL